MRSWTFRLKKAGNGFIVSDAADDGTGDLCDVFMTNDPKIAEGRARLIAAAPELFEALKSASRWITGTGYASAGYTEVLEEINLAIAKAETSTGLHADDKS